MLPECKGLSPTEIEITPEMVAAGRVETFGFDAAYDDSGDLVSRVFESMAEAAGLKVVARGSRVTT